MNKIKKGRLGDFSKVVEEFEELKQAKEYGLKIHVLMELSDLVGAIHYFLEKEYKGEFTFEDVILQTNAKINWFLEKEKKRNETRIRKCNSRTQARRNGD